MEIMSQINSKMKAIEALTKIYGCGRSEAQQMSPFVTVWFFFPSFFFFIFFRLCRRLLTILSISLE